MNTQYNLIDVIVLDGFIVFISFPLTLQRYKLQLMFFENIEQIWKT